MVEADATVAIDRPVCVQIGLVVFDGQVVGSHRADAAATAIVHDVVADDDVVGIGKVDAVARGVPGLGVGQRVVVGDGRAIALDLEAVDYDVRDAQPIDADPVRGLDLGMRAGRGPKDDPRLDGPCRRELHDRVVRGSERAVRDVHGVARLDDIGRALQGLQRMRRGQTIVRVRAGRAHVEASACDLWDGKRRRGGTRRRAAGPGHATIRVAQPYVVT